jgi:chaperonin GroES
MDSKINPNLRRLHMINLKPLGNRVLIKRSKAKTTKGGILLPDTAQEKPKEGQVVAVGPGKVDESGRHEPLNVKVGDTILFSSYSGTEVKNPVNQEEEYLILSEDDVLGIVA